MSESPTQYRFTITNGSGDVIRDYWTTGPASRSITWISEDEVPKDPETIARRVLALQMGEDQWGHVGAHHGWGGDPECPPFPHHHHDFRCAMPTERECEIAGVPYRTRWGGRA